MKKLKYFSALISLILATSLCSCKPSKKSEDSILDKNNPITITIWHYYNGVQQMNFDAAVNEFNDTIGYDNGIIVEAYSKGSISELADSINDSVNKSAGAAEPPDIFAAYAENAYALDKMGVIADIGKYFTDEEISEYVDEYIEEGRFSGDNSIRIFPTAKSTEVMILNVTDWQDFADSEGVTTDNLKTWEGIAETAEKYYNYTDKLTPDIKNDGKAFFGRDSIANYMIVGAKQLGSEFISMDENNKPVLNIDKDTVRKLWDNYYVPYVKGFYISHGRYRSDDVKLGKSIAIICSTTGAAYYPSEVTIDDEYTYPIENIVLPVPGFEGTEPYVVQQGAGMSVISSDEKTEYASILFLKWFTQEERNIKFSINSGYMPVKKEANNFEKISEVNKETDENVNETLLDSIKLAIDEVNNYSLYTMKPFDSASEVRDFLGEYIQQTAEKDYEKATDRINSGENRDDVIAEYSGDEAFEKWFSEFKTSLENIVK